MKIAALLDVFLNVADRAVDREQASSRASEVAEIMGNLPFSRARELPELCRSLMQHLSEVDYKALEKVVRSLDKAEIRDQTKTFCLGLELLKCVGPQVLRSAVDHLVPGVEPARIQLKLSA